MTREELLRVRWRDVSAHHMDELRKLYGGRCQRPGCGARSSRQGRRRLGPLEFAHVKPTGLCGRGRGLQHRFFDILRNPDCYRLLCRSCHGWMDLGRRLDVIAAAAPIAI
jgi:hypothetical protein